MNQSNLEISDLVAILLQAEPPVVDAFVFFSSTSSKKKLVRREWVTYLN